jgi:hypothetical protein
MPGSTRMVAFFDQNGFEGQQLPLNHFRMDGIEHSTFSSIADQQNQVTMGIQ